MLGVEQHSLHIKDTSKPAVVPNNSMARLMYYLGTVNSLIDFGIPERLTRYSNYNYISHDEEDQILILSTILSPDIFVQKRVMINAPQLCGNSLNKFYEISDTTNRFAVTSEFIIGGKKVHTLKIMAFKTEWIKNNYINPIQFYSGRLTAIARAIESSQPRYTVLPRNYSDSNEHTCQKCILI